MVLKVHGMSTSTCSRFVLIALEEKNVPYEFIEVDYMSGAHKKPEYTQYHPFGMMPYIDDDGFILYECRAIARYIANKYASRGTPLIPTDLKANALFEQAASVEISYFHPHARGILYETLYKKYYGLETDQAVLDQHVKDLSVKLEVYDQILSKQRYLAGDEVTLADLFHLPCGIEFENLGIDWLSQKPNVARWWKDISSRPSWLAIMV